MNATSEETAKKIAAIIGVTVSELTTGAAQHTVSGNQPHANLAAENERLKAEIERMRFESRIRELEAENASLRASLPAPASFEQPAPEFKARPQPEARQHPESTHTPKGKAK